MALITDIENSEITLTINGQEQTLPLAKAIEMAQKAGASDQRFQEASAMRKEAEALMGIKTLLLKGVNEDDADAFKQALVTAGVSADAADEVLGLSVPDIPSTPPAASAPETPDTTPKPTDNAEVTALKSQVEQLTRAMTILVDQQKQTKQTSQTASQAAQIAQALDKDSTFGTIMRDPNHKAVAQTVIGWALNKAQANKAVPWGSAAIEHAITELKADPTVQATIKGLSISEAANTPDGTFDGLKKRLSAGPSSGVATGDSTGQSGKKTNSEPQAALGDQNDFNARFVDILKENGESGE